MLGKQQKEQIVNNFKSSFSDTPSFLLVNFRGAKVSEFELLRKKLRDNNAVLTVVKNNLLKKASENTDFESIFTDSVGETAITFLEENYVEVTKTFVEIEKDFPNLEIRVGFIEGKSVDKAELEKISKLPSREVLISQMISMLNQPIVKFINVSKAIPRNLVNVLNNLKDKK
ncbi:50S ribosomal protein L10 [bacterium]|jgi:large subunit ribosomal protein L10|nr:50S ribosomal protein L10 [bacterium]MDG2006407.1 50S ribosomal protein L10 [Thermodesulfobacteriota bacterium]